MKHWLMDLLYCPAKECNGELNMDLFRSHNIELNGEDIEEIDEALLTCTKCGRWYPVIDRITCMLPDEMRLEGKQHIEETAFLERWKERIPNSILKNGKPFGLESN